jgi:8-oxo-dGTP pyrophosphatase MutT (NUDIX family)
LDYLDEADIVKIPKIKGIKYIKSGDGIYNPYVIHNGQKYRPRVETLIFNDKEQIFLNNNGVPNKYGTTYILTGGGIDKGKKLEDQAAAECKEEARIIIKNITYTGITYISPYHGMYPSWQKEKLWPYGLKYEGAITYVFVAEYDKKYNGYVAPVDSVDNMWTVGKWYNPEDLPLRKEHKQAVKFYNKYYTICTEKTKEVGKKNIEIEIYAFTRNMLSFGDDSFVKIDDDDSIVDEMLSLINKYKRV